jgi:8-oxo-dGTP diphosphatase
MHGTVLGRFLGGYREDGRPWHFSLFKVSRRLPANLKPVRAVVGVVVEDDHVLAIDGERGWDLPGGHLDGQEIPRQALVRELGEEACVSVTSARPIAVLESDDHEQPSYMVAYAAKAKLRPFMASDEGKSRAFLPFNDFLARYTGGASKELAKMLLELADAEPQGSERRQPKFKQAGY